VVATEGGAARAVVPAAPAPGPDAQLPWEHREADGRTVRIARDANGDLVAAIRASDGSLLVEFVLLERARPR
jgi:YD repeat-containing protein